MLTPLQSKLIQHSLGVKHHLSKEMNITIKQFEKMVTDVIKPSEHQSPEIQEEVRKNAKNIKKILGKKFDRTIILKSFPRNWESILREKSKIYTASFRNKDFLNNKIEEIIQALKEGKRFDIGNNVSMMKVFGYLAEECGIYFTFLHGFGFVVDFKPILTNEIAEFQSESFQKALRIVNSDSGELYDEKTRLFYEFITQVVVTKTRTIFTINEIQEFYENHGYSDSGVDILTFLKKLKMRGPALGINIKNGKNGQMNYTFDFKSLVFGNFIKQYFPTNTSEFEQKFDQLFESYKNKSFIELLKKEILLKNSEPNFFKSREFIDKYSPDLYNRVVLALKAAKDAQLIAIKGKDSYYIKTEILKSSLNYEHIIEQFRISGKITKYHIHILNYILADIAHIIEVESLGENDIHISIFADLKVIEITLNHPILEKHKNKIMFIGDEIGEKMGHNIVIR